MRASLFGIALLALGFALAGAPVAPAQADPAPPAEAWTPVRVFIGSWSGTAGSGKEKVTRQVASSNDNRRLVVLERNRDEIASWGEIAYDAGRHNLVLLPREGAPELVLEPADPARAPGRLVFASAENAAHGARVSYEFTGWTEFVERHEERTADGTFAVTRETRFKRGNAKLALKPSADAQERTAGR